MKGWFNMKKILFFFLLFLIPTFSVASIVKHNSKETESKLLTADKPKEYLESEFILKGDGTAYTLDGRAFTGVWVHTPKSSEIYAKMTKSFKDGKMDGETLVYDSDNHIRMKQFFKKGKLTNVEEYYKDGELRFEVELHESQVTYGAANYPNGKPYVSFKRVIDSNDKSQHSLLRFFDFQKELVGQISTNEKGSYAICILPDGTTKKMTRIYTNSKFDDIDSEGKIIRKEGDILNDILKDISEDWSGVVAALEELTGKVSDGQEFKCEFE